MFADFHAFNVVTSFRRLFQVPSTVTDKEHRQQAVVIHEEAVTTLMETFQPQEIANILHITVKSRYKTSLLPALERRAEVVAGKFNSQDVANTIWVLPTMGRKPGDRLMDLLEGTSADGGDSRGLYLTEC
jgi:hypothetical protein